MPLSGSSAKDQAQDGIGYAGMMMANRNSDNDQ